METPENLRGLAAYMDHTLLAPTATESQIRTLCTEAAEHHFKTVCVNGSYLGLAREVLAGTGVGLAAVVGFPLGATSTPAKRCEAEACLEAGATELDMVVNLGRVKSGDWAYLEAELKTLRKAAPATCLKLILETCYLDESQKKRLCALALDADWDFVKTSTGFGPAGATLEDVALMRLAVSGKLGVKASGGIRNLETALAYIRAGATRIGTSSAVGILGEARAHFPG